MSEYFHCKDRKEMETLASMTIVDILMRARPSSTSVIDHNRKTELDPDDSPVHLLLAGETETAPGDPENSPLMIRSINLDQDGLTGIQFFGGEWRWIHQFTGMLFRSNPPFLSKDPHNIKFYTEEGNWDVVGNNTPVFFFRDPLRFPTFPPAHLCLCS